jgi:predicted DNA-binding protein
VVGNQYTGKTVDKHLTLRLPAGIRTRLDAEADRRKISKADIVRAALESYLPLLETLSVEGEKRG